MDTGQPLVTSKGMYNYLHDPHKAYYAYILMYIQKYIMHYYMWHMDTGDSFYSTTKRTFSVIRRTILAPGVCLCICI